MMKRIFLVLLSLVVLSSTSFTAYADVIWVPEGDSFFEEHEDECEYEEGTYSAAGVDDSINVYVSPEDTSIVETINNETLLYPSWRWNDWFLIDNGWIHSDDVAVVYDGLAFMREHEVEAVERIPGDFKEVQFYTYPHSGESTKVIEDPQYMLISSSFSAKYVDDAGLTWGYINYYMGQSGWVCTDDPTNENFSNNPPMISQSVSQLRGSDKEVEETTSPLLVATGLVIGVCVITFLLLIKKKKGTA